MERRERVSRLRTRCQDRLARLRARAAEYRDEFALMSTPGPFLPVPCSPVPCSPVPRLPVPRLPVPLLPVPAVALTPPSTPAASPVVVTAKARTSVRRGETQMSAQARAEATVVTRVQQLQTAGKWAGSKKCLKLPEPGVPKAHWAYVLEEMTWLSSVVQQEMKLRKSTSRKCARMVQKHFQERGLAAVRAAKANEVHKRKLAAFMAKEVRGFWANIQKLFEYQLQRQIEVTRKEALDVHLNFIVDKTEKFSTLLAESLATTTNSTPGASDGELSDTTGGGASSRGHSRQDGEYRPAESSDDDEATITQDDDQREASELDELNREADIPVEDLLKKFHPELFDGASSEADPPPPASPPSPEVEADEAQAEEAKNLKLLVDPEADSDNDEFFGAIEAAAQFKPTGNTLDTTSVKTKVPFLLKHTLREYQHIGLDWLVSLHEREFNGILADEMGLGKTIQTIALLAHLACEKKIWGPHLIVVPTSVMLNWEMEIKKWCPAFKILTYYGSQKERRAKRVGWTKAHSFHICITSYKLVIQDHSSFRRKQWHYLILDEAQHIKNFKSQRWQMLLNFSSQARLLLTGTPLQNNLMELWSLMHFLMPHVFQSHRNFKEWFSNPLTGMVEDTAEYNDSLVKRLHKVLRPFLLRRLKNEVEKQMPKKYEHIISCPLSKRQRYLYDDFMSRSKTQETLVTGNFLNVINILMQLRKVCNHPNLFEPRPTLSPFVCNPILEEYSPPKQISQALDYRPIDEIDLSSHSLCLVNKETSLSAFDAFNLSRLKVKDVQKCVRLLATDSQWILPPQCPRNEFRMRVTPVPLPGTQKDVINFSNVINNNLYLKGKKDLSIRIQRGTYLLVKVPDSLKLPPDPRLVCDERIQDVSLDLPMKRSLSPQGSPTKGIKQVRFDGVGEAEEEPEFGIFSAQVFRGGLKSRQKAVQREYLEICSESLARKFILNENRCRSTPLYGVDLILAVSNLVKGLEEFEFDLPRDFDQMFLERFHIFIPSVICANKYIPRSQPNPLIQEVQTLPPPKPELSFNLLLPDLRLIQYDCGKLQVMSGLLRKLKAGSHRVLIFTQMTKMLDVLESFLNYHGYIYLRLDGSTKVEQRQALMERFNADSKYFAFILSTRSGGVGINLTGADTVIFYDSDWNPTMDAQAQDRCHRIGQTRDVHIYRLISEHTVEENILKKANQKRLLGDLAIEGGNFTTASLKTQTIRDIFTLNKADEAQESVGHESEEKQKDSSVGAFETAIASVEDELDSQALISARKEANEDAEDFEEGDKGQGQDSAQKGFISQLTPIEKYAYSLMEDMESDWKSQQINAAESELANQKKILAEQKSEGLEEDEQLEEEEVEEEEEGEESDEGEEDESDGADDEESDEGGESEEHDTRESDGEEDEEESGDAPELMSEAGEEDEEEEEEEEEEESDPEVIRSPKTRSRGNVRINLWSLDS